MVDEAVPESCAQVVAGPGSRQGGRLGLAITLGLGALLRVLAGSRWSEKLTSLAVSARDLPYLWGVMRRRIRRWAGRTILALLLPLSVFAQNSHFMLAPAFLAKGVSVFARRTVVWPPSRARDRGTPVELVIEDDLAGRSLPGQDITGSPESEGPVSMGRRYAKLLRNPDFLNIAQAVLDLSPYPEVHVRMNSGPTTFSAAAWTGLARIRGAGRRELLPVVHLAEIARVHPRWAPEILLHELAHAAHPPGDRSRRRAYGPDGVHLIDEVLSWTTAFMEGWANYQSTHLSESFRRSDFIGTLLKTLSPALRIEGRRPGEYRWIYPWERRAADYIGNELAIAGMLVEFEKLAGQSAVRAAFLGQRHLRTPTFASLVGGLVQARPELRHAVLSILLDRTYNLGSPDFYTALLDGRLPPGVRATERRTARRRSRIPAGWSRAAWRAVCPAASAPDALLREPNVEHARSGVQRVDPCEPETFLEQGGEASLSALCHEQTFQRLMTYHLGAGTRPGVLDRPLRPRSSTLSDSVAPTE